MAVAKTEEAPALKMVSFGGQTPTPFDEHAIELDRDRLIDLYYKKLLTNWQLVMFALEHDYGAMNLPDRVDFDVFGFVSRWGMDLGDFWTAIAALRKKKVWRCSTKQLTLELFKED